MRLLRLSLFLPATIVVIIAVSIPAIVIVVVIIVIVAVAITPHTTIVPRVPVPADVQHATTDNDPLPHGALSLHAVIARDAATIARMNLVAVDDSRVRVESTIALSLRA